MKPALRKLVLQRMYYSWWQLRGHPHVYANIRRIGRRCYGVGYRLLNVPDGTPDVKKTASWQAPGDEDIYPTRAGAVGAARHKLGSLPDDAA